ncbi:MAG: phosphate/phosphite/phosphonate ABC transporter substrate-binding protein [Proteobacteria bacterium]|nr:phosphate/phosphite/phosphonate ABC transporter substrate-binding protein [Pseudomonadota bacterium]MBU1640030.1 phosphate/phosphite/phosphonate ABC transporter substrate-binding protein [Pseudomonadota bacterium]
MQGKSAWAFSEFYYFNPDSSQSNLSRLKKGMDTLLADAGINLSFQPFARLQDFDRQIRMKPPAFVMVPSWYVDMNKDAWKFHPLLRPTRGGATTYHKVLLVATNATFELKQLGSKTVAMTSMGPGGLDFLNTLIFNEHGLDAHQLNIVTTAKDVDALFALALHQVDAALVSKANLEHIAEINPRIAKNVKVVAVSGPISLPALYYYGSDANNIEMERVKKIFLQHDQYSMSIREMLQVDGWQDYEN